MTIEVKRENPMDLLTEQHSGAGSGRSFMKIQWACELIFAILLCDTCDTCDNLIIHIEKQTTRKTFKMLLQYLTLTCLKEY